MSSKHRLRALERHRLPKDHGVVAPGGLAASAWLDLFSGLAGEPALACEPIYASELARLRRGDRGGDDPRHQHRRDGAGGDRVVVPQ